MDINNIPVPTSKADMEKIRKMARQELSEENLDAVTGGHERVNRKTDSARWTCPFCGANITIRQEADSAKHMVKCPGNPYK